jgi:3-carboxy-cis,cis-muconate cycloisomerase
MAGGCTGVRPRRTSVFTAMTGGAAGTFASLGPDGPRVQDAVAARLGLASMAVPSRAIAGGLAGYVCLPGATGTIGSSAMPHTRNPRLSYPCITIGARLRALVPLALAGMLHGHEVGGAHPAMMEDAPQQACELSGDLLARLQVIVAGLEADQARMRASLALSGALISSEAVLPGLGRALGRQAAHEVVYDAARAATPACPPALPAPRPSRPAPPRTTSPRRGKRGTRTEAAPGHTDPGT